MTKFLTSLIVIALSVMLFSACSHTISIQQAANGKAGKCGRNHL